MAPTSASRASGFPSGAKARRVSVQVIARTPDGPHGRSSACDPCLARKGWTRLSPVMRVVNIHEAKTHLSKLVEEAAEGKELIIAKAGKPMAKLVPARKVRRRRKLGSMAGRFVVPDDFDAALPDGVVDAFEGADRAPPR